MASETGSKDRASELRDALRHRRGPTRVRLLTELAQLLVQQHAQVVGSPAGAPLLDEAIACMEEAHTYTGGDERIVAQGAALLGWLLANRRFVYGGVRGDVDRAIQLLEQGVTGPRPAPGMRLIGLLTLGQLLLNRAIEPFRAGDAARLFAGGAKAQAEDADRAAHCFRLVLDAAGGPETRKPAETLLIVADAMRDMIAASPGDLDRMAKALATMQRFQDQMSAGPTVGPAPSTTREDHQSLGYPAMTVYAEPPATPDAAIPLTDIARHLEPGAELPDTTVIDELVAVAAARVESPYPTPGERLLFASAVFLRSLVDDGGWGEPSGATDHDIARQTLLNAVPGLADAPADAVVLAFRLAAALEPGPVSSPTWSRLVVPFAPVAAALRACGADALLYPFDGGALLFPASGTNPDFVPERELRMPRLIVASDWPSPNGAVSQVGSASQLVDLAARTRPAVNTDALFVVDPRGDGHDGSADHTRRLFYPHALCFGQATGGADARGTADEVRSHLRRSMLHLACGVTAGGGLELAGGTVLEPTDMLAPDGQPPGGGVVLLPPVAAPAALIDALLASHFAAVVCWRAAVPPAVAALAYHLLHHRLGHGDAPVTAVAAVRRWLADPAREELPGLPEKLLAVLRSSQGVDPASAAALVLRGV
ncbi:hypothetical protein [Actinoplanes aureus]|uniref:CHAT domain-containing protein n=1 Tax=Actinoplanes aureus TaxID=2792083 RepID=A0A931CDB9_9ACTN|nr:hypothetical protein [Actinoplanes aureus]MBG0567815.1 hypothetical protein [Actinoplanes aureus]